MKKIFIDPGHGGADPGAIGHGLAEKDVTLAIALELKELLNKKYKGYMVNLSRATDRTMSLQDRTNKANRWGADYLLSIHVNAGGGTGFESFIYHYSQLRKTATAKLQKVIHNELIKKINLHNRGMKEANFHMLRESRMPALLTENGFIDHPSDARLLQDTTFIRKIAMGHAKGLAAAFQLPEQSVTNLSANKHVIQKGDTLWSLAITYETTVQTLQQLNPHLEPTQLRIGAEIKLP